MARRRSCDTPPAARPKRAKPASPPPPPTPPPAANGQAKPRRLAAIAAGKYLWGDEITSRPAQWLWAGYLPLGVPTVLYGPCGSGKSTLLAAIATAVVNGTSPTGLGTRPPGKVAWMAGEEVIAEDVLPRLAAYGADMRRVLFPQCGRDTTRRPWRLPDHLADLTDLVVSAEISLLILDPVSCFCGADSPAEGNQAARAVLGALTDLGARTSTSSIAVKHPRKSGRGGSLEQMSGGLEWMNTPRQVLLAGRHPAHDGSYLLAAQKKSRGVAVPCLEYQIIGKDDSAVIQWIGDSEVSAAEVLAEELSRSEQTALAEAKEFLVDYLEDGPRRSKLILQAAQDCGISPMTLRRAKDDLGVVPLRAGTGEDIYWQWTLKEKED